jgi:hypothetical protein
MHQKRDYMLDSLTMKKKMMVLQRPRLWPFWTTSCTYGINDDVPPPPLLPCLDDAIRNQSCLLFARINVALKVAFSDQSPAHSVSFFRKMSILKDESQESQGPHVSQVSRKMLVDKKEGNDTLCS